ncbi:hypothetical protein AB4Z40_27205 [Bosea sp. 2YAB26]
MGNIIDLEKHLEAKFLAEEQAAVGALLDQFEGRICRDRPVQPG